VESDDSAIVEPSWSLTRSFTDASRDA